jgi:RNA polymerase sigma-70 factor (ECF subfamily)
MAQRIEAARHGCRESLGALTESCRGYLLRIANDELGRTGLAARVGASDLVQEALLRASTHFDQFRGNTGEELIHWLRTLLLNYLVTAIRRHRLASVRSDRQETSFEGGDDSTAWEPAQTGEAGETPSKILARDEELERLFAALDELPQHYREVILLRSFGDCSHAELGELLNRSPEAARKLWVRAVAALARALNPADSQPRGGPELHSPAAPAETAGPPATAPL